MRALRSADVPLAHSHFIADHLRSNRLERVHIAPLFLPRPARRARFPARPRVLFVGRVTPPKGLDVLVRAIAELDVPLDVCGAGWGLPRVRRLIDKLQIADRVTFHDRVAPARMSDFYANATIVAVPSLWPEPFGLVGLEAMAHERPVVASATGGIPEWLSHGETGLLVRPGDPVSLARAIATLAADPTMSQGMGSRGAERVMHRFSRERYLTGVTAAYEEAREHWRQQGS
jgi:glycosyltransferase involved in cell wall biosynthesis